MIANEVEVIKATLKVAIVKFTTSNSCIWVNFECGDAEILTGLKVSGSNHKCKDSNQSPSSTEKFVPWEPLDIQISKT